VKLKDIGMKEALCGHFVTFLQYIAMKDLPKENSAAILYKSGL